MPKKVQTTIKLCSFYDSEVMLKILQARFQQYVNQELPDVQAEFRKGRGAREQTVNVHWIIEKARKSTSYSKKTSTFASLTMPKPLTVWIMSNCGKFFKRLEYQTTLPASWETCMQVKKQVRTRYGTMDWFQNGKGVRQGCISSPWLFNLYAEYIMRKAGLDEAQTGIKIARRNINHLR